ncbi:MAG: NTP transferase domain-containing protein [Acidimicrobiia bacterium]|nr:NTP transferase domain-containing protein [Acidimicrobiia bacterium]
MSTTGAVEPTIVVMAAGLGRRFGGLKQIAPVGPRGESLLAYSLDDAAAAGFGRVVLVVRREIEDAVLAHVRQHCGDRDYVAVHQDCFGPPRATPWGTAHAIVACRDAVAAPFAVVNADDLYGAAALTQLGEHLRGPDSGPGHAALVAYSIGDTLSAGGGVSRATVHVTADGRLARIRERTGVRAVDGRIVSDTGELSPDSLVSMNLWGFDPSVFDLLAPLVDSFMADHPDDSEEIVLPDAVGTLIERGQIEVTVLPTTSRWVGITFAEDVAPARAAVRAMRR